MSDTVTFLRFVLAFVIGVTLNKVVNAVGGLDSKEGIFTFIIGLLVGALILILTYLKEDN